MLSVESLRAVAHLCPEPVLDGIFNGLECSYRRTVLIPWSIIGGRWLIQLIIIGCYGDREDRMMIPMWLQRCPSQMSRSLQPFPHPCAVDTRAARLPFKEQSTPRGTFSFLNVVPPFFSLDFARTHNLNCRSSYATFIKQIARFFSCLYLFHFRKIFTAGQILSNWYDRLVRKIHNLFVILHWQIYDETLKFLLSCAVGLNFFF